MMKQPWLKVEFYTSDDKKDVIKHVNQLNRVGMLNVTSFDDLVGEVQIPEPKQPMSDHKQLLIIWLLAIITVLCVLLFIEWGTRP